MRSVSVREFRAKLAELLESREPLLITRHGSHLAVVYPLAEAAALPPTVRRDVADRLTDGIHKTLEVDRSAGSEVIDSYKRDVDRTLIRENLRKTPQERLEALQQLQRFAGEVRRAGGRRRR